MAPERKVCSPEAAAFHATTHTMVLGYSRSRLGRPGVRTTKKEVEAQ